LMSEVLNPALAFGAGVLTILSPCVLPLVPIVLASAAQKHRFGPLALCAGLILSFTLVAMAAATASSGLLADSENLRVLGAGLIGIVGLFLISQHAQHWLGVAAAPMANWAQSRKDGFDSLGLTGQFAIGLLLGLIWIPCVGPTLGAATVLASQGERLGEVTLIMAAYAAGIASVLLVLALTARSALKRANALTLKMASRAKKLLGIVMVVVAGLVITGADHVIEGAFLLVMPEAIIDFATRL
jgi:cytochrome c-type biogenesis protein